MSLTIGILMIGSLYWGNETTRDQWRRERLNLNALRPVFAPIRYGRRSQKRGNSYTMVLSTALGEDEPYVGGAFAVPCNRTVKSTEDLVNEAEMLWTAERKSDSSDGRISAPWGCVALLRNSIRPFASDLIDGWSARVASENGYGKFAQADSRQALITASGVLNVTWPQQRDGSPLELDAMLVAATSPTLIDGQYPTAQEIAAAWKAPKGKQHVDYFWKNREHGIFTFQDAEIEHYLNQ